MHPGITSGCAPPATILGACILAATEIYVGMTSDRADRPAHTSAEAAAELRSTRAAAALWAIQHAIVSGGGAGRPTNRRGARVLAQRHNCTQALRQPRRSIGGARNRTHPP
jgi:hypothetical protein